METKRKKQKEYTIHKIRDPASNMITSDLDGIQKALKIFRNPFTINRIKLMSPLLKLFRPSLY